jgi:hypothetical protein
MSNETAGQNAGRQIDRKDPPSRELQKLVPRVSADDGEGGVQPFVNDSTITWIKQAPLARQWQICCHGFARTRESLALAAQWGLLGTYDSRLQT